MKRIILASLIVFFAFMPIATPLNYEIKTTLVSVTNVATKIPATPMVGRTYLLITNTDASTTVYLGASTVTASGATTGTPLYPYEHYYAEYESNVDIYGITSSGTVSVIVEEGL